MAEASLDRLDLKQSAEDSVQAIVGRKALRTGQEAYCIEE